MLLKDIFVDYFVKSYSSAYSVNLVDGSFEILHMDHDFSEIFKMDGNMDDMIAFIKNYIHPEDQSMMLRTIGKDYVTNRLREENSFTFVVREIYNHQQRTMRGLIIKDTDEYHVAVGFLNITEELQK